MSQLHQPTRGPRRSRRGPFIVTVAAAAAVTAIAVAAAVIFIATRGASERLVTFTGQVVLVDTDPTTTKFTWSENGSCAGAKRFADVVEGASVEVRDENGKVLGVAQLGAGVPDGFREGGKVATRCTFLIHAKPVPEERVYRIAVGRQAPVTVDADQIGQVTVRLGG